METLLVAISGNHLAGKDSDSVNGLTLESTNITSIPGNIAKFFSNIKGLSFLGSKIATVFASDLEPFPELVNVKFRLNQIVAIDGNLFKHNQKLK
jgi:Leucine-rich repeat (LRR) protein